MKENYKKILLAFQNWLINVVLSINIDQSVLVRFPSYPPLSQLAHPSSRRHPIHRYYTRSLLSILEKVAWSFLDSCQSSISKDQVRAGLAVCAPAGLWPQWEPLTGAEDTRVARDTNAFRWSWPHKGTASQHANAKFLVCLFVLSGFSLQVWMRIREFVAYWFSGSVGMNKREFTLWS